MKHMIDADLLEDFYEALSAAIESGINVPGSHAVTDMFREAVARAEAAEAERDALLNISMTEPEPGAGCWRCGREIKPGEMSPNGRVHNNPLICVFVYMRRLIVAEGEITALRAQVDGQEWRPVTDEWPSSRDNRLYWIYQQPEALRVGGYRLARFDGEFYDPKDHAYLEDNSVKYAMCLPAILPAAQ